MCDILSQLIFKVNILFGFLLANLNPIIVSIELAVSDKLFTASAIILTLFEIIPIISFIIPKIKFVKIPNIPATFPTSQDPPSTIFPRLD